MKTQLIIAAAVAAVSLSGFAASAQPQEQFVGGPGIVMAGSQNYEKLPGKARKFISKHFKNVGVAKCEQSFAKGQYEVDLANGVEIDFDSKGEVIEIDAPDNAYLSPAVSKDLLHDSAFGKLEKKGLLNKVESIEFKKGRAVEVSVDQPGPDTYIFDVVEGELITIED